MSHRENEEYPVPALYVENTSQALLDLAGGYRTMCGGKVVGVTGSVGKTTTKELVSAVLGEKFNVMFTQGNFNNDVGVPKTLFRLWMLIFTLFHVHQTKIPMADNANNAAKNINNLPMISSYFCESVISRHLNRPFPEFLHCPIPLRSP